MGKMKTMKRFIYGIMAIWMLALPSCQSDLLEENPKSFLTPENFYQSSSDAFAGLMGIYALISDKTLYGSYLSQESYLGTDIAYYRKNSGGLHYYANHLMTNTSGNLQTTWQQAYKTIYACNLYIESITEKAPIAEDEKNRFIAEATFIRGLVYFELARIYGGIPLITSITPVSELQIPRNTLEEVYKQVETDLLFAKQHLPWITEMSDGDHPRASKNAVLGILTRVYITMAGNPLNDQSKWAAASATAKELIDLGYHNLHDNYNQVWLNVKDDVYDLHESIWEIGYTAGDLGNNLGTFNGIPSSKGPNGEESKTVGGGYSFVKSTLTMRKYYGEDGNGYDKNLPDSRYHWNCVAYKLDGTNKPTLKDGEIVEQSEWALTKFRKNSSNGAYHYNKNGLNWVVLRYADILLMYAEAENELNGAGRSAEANQALTTIRQRALRTINEDGSFVQANDQPIEEANYNYDYSTMDQETFRQFIRDERARELAGEGVRRWDLVRWGILYETVKSLDGVEPKGYCWKNIQPYHVLFPIPQQEIDLNPMLKQNTGY
ncbi:RagB/SusD family nutrient uptake outer membrane protein [Puteibacter caeruleilacunae]|nr:RagB/SusD family nutrient uptake outer membrane protein [Puteibacter caeruleilacunae]